ncbi:MAG: tetratricopeptide repeat protein, partial [Spirulina sp. DLM2.Bin59]
MLQQWLKTLSKRINTGSTPGAATDPVTSDMAEPNQPLSDRDYEFLFTQLLEGIAHGWQPVRIQRFFETLSPRGTIAQWGEWLQRYGAKILASSAPNTTLARRMVALGEQTRSLPDLKQLGETASGIGRLLLARERTEDTDTWQYEEKPQPAPPPGEEPVPPVPVELDASGIESPPLEAVVAQTDPTAITLDELLVRLQGDKNLVQQVAQRLGLDTQDPQEIIQELVRQINERNAAAAVPTPVPVDEPVVGNTAAEQVFNEGVQAYEAGRFEAAITCWDRAIQLKPDYYQAWGYRGLGLKNLKRYEEAIASYTKAVELKPDFHKAWYNKGLALDELGRHREAIAAYDRVIEVRPDFPKAWFSRGNSLDQVGDMEGAIAAYDRAIELKKDFPKAWLNRGQALSQLGRYDEALASYDGALQFKVDDLDLWQQRALALTALGRYDEAVSSYARALSLKPNDPLLLRQQGEALAAAGGYAQAISVYDLILEQHPEDATVWCNRGQALAALGWEVEAIAAYRRAVELDANFALAWHGLGEALEAQRNYPEALDCYDHTLQLEPNIPIPWVNRAQTLMALGRVEEAIASFDRAIQLQTHRWQAWQGRSEAAQTSPRADLLLSSLSSVAQAQPALNQRGHAGQLATLQYGLNQISPQQYPEAWARIQQQLGRAYHNATAEEPGKQWRQALDHYQAGLDILDPQQSPRAYLELLQSKMLTALSLEEFPQAQATYRAGRELFQTLSDQANLPWGQKRQLALTMATLNHLYVDATIQAGELAAALELSELGRNFAIAWLWERLPLQEGSLRWPEIQRRLDEKTAILYWHCSPAGLTTFIITAQTAEPLVLGHTPNVVLNVVLSPALRSRVELAKQNSEASLAILLELLGLEEHQGQLTTSPPKSSEATPDNPTAPTAQARSAAFHDWFQTWQNQDSDTVRKEIPHHLRELNQILGIGEILEILKERAINHLILVPHQALHCVPLHALFPDQFTTSYLPSLRLAQPSSLPHPEASPPATPAADPWLQSEADEDWLSLGLADVPTPELTAMSLLCLEANLDQHLDVALESVMIGHQFAKVQRLNTNVTSLASSRQALGTGYRYWHCFSPIVQNAKQPSQSFLAFGEQNKLTFADLGSLSLSDCELISFAYPEQSTTPYPTYQPDHVSGVTALLSQGVTYVLHPLWEVDPQARNLFMIEFYRRLTLGSSPLVAHKQVQLWLRTVTYNELVRWYLDRAQDLEATPNTYGERLTALANQMRQQGEAAQTKEPPFGHHRLSLSSLGSRKSGLS